MSVEFENRGISTEIASDMQDAVLKAISKAKKGDVVYFPLHVPVLICLKITLTEERCLKKP
jgi:UDP-N-acetylmuramyl tripeptide synthase